MKSCCSGMMLIGRIFIAAIFLLSGIGKLLAFENTAQFMAAKGMPVVHLLLAGAAAIEILGALSLLIGFKTRIGATALFLFMIPTTLIFHDFWNYTGNESDLQMIMFMKNIAIEGGLLYVMACGSGGCGFDRNCCHKEKCEEKKNESL